MRIGRILVMLAAVMAVSAGNAVGIERITVPKKPIRIPGLTLPLLKPDYPEIGTANASKLTMLWHTKLVEVGAGVTTAPQIDVDQATGLVVASSTTTNSDTGEVISKLQALNPRDGSIRWTLTLTTPGGSSVIPTYGLPRVGNGCVYVSPGWGTLSAFDLPTSNQRWQKSVPCARVGTLTVAGDAVYGTGTDALFAVDVRTGALRWSATDKGTPSYPTVDGGIVYTGSAKGIYAVDAAKGTPKWNLNPVSARATSPVVRDGKVFWLANGMLYAYDAATHGIKWKKPAPVGSYGDSPVTAGEYVYICPGDNKVYAFDTSTGDRKWAADTPYASAPTPMPLINGVLFLPGYEVAALDAKTGAPLWTYGVPGNLFNSLAAMGNSMVFGVCRGEVYAFTVK